MFKSGVHRSSSLQQERRVQRKVCVYDHRYPHRREVNKRCLETTNLDFSGFCQVLRQEFEISSNEPFVVVTTDRTLLDSGKFEELQDGSTLHLFQRENQALSETTKEHIKFEPHHNTITGCGLYAYYASEGQNPLPYALAELIDNSLSATAKNKGERTIEIRVLFDEIRGKPAVIILDNGCGMTSKQLNNWAVYRLSKFNREDSKFASQQEAYVRPDPVPRSLNSDISFFGVGGKQAAFYIGESTMMISKPVGSPDVHELVLSKEDFERKARDKEDVYSAEITHRKPGDSSHVKKDDERFLHDLIREEHGKESFTAVVITGVKPEHITFLKDNFKLWTRQLAHVYHYYIHGVNGNDVTSSATKPDHHLKIEITLRRKPPACPCVMNLTEVEDDMQSLYIRAAADTFEFRAAVEKDGGTVEGIIRYHPFLYDRETYPEDPCAEEAPSKDNNDDDDESGDQSQERKEKKIFECFWNGRLIPYTKVSELFWCSRSSRNKNPNVPAECYSRLSGVLFTDDKFTVTTNKLTYTDLELKLDKKTIFTRVVKGQKQSGRNIEKDFMQWLENCHEKYDKQRQFLGYKETITRSDVSPKTRQYPWAVFSSIKWGGEIYKKGQYVKSQRTQPILYGTVIRFLLYGDHSGNVFATNGVVEVALEPKAFHDKNKIIPISKIDRAATEEAIKKNIENDLAKLPHNLTVDWPEGNPWPENAVRPAGTPLGPIKVEILNKSGGSTPRMPTVGQGIGKKLVVGLKVTHNGKDVVSYVAQHSPNWGFYFKKMANLSRLGKYTLTLTTAIHENNATVFGGRQLPSYKLNFTIKEGDAESFVICPVSSALHVGLPFDIPLRIKDGYEHPALPPPNLEPVLECSGLDVTYEKVDVSGTTVTIRSVRARGKLPNYQQSKQCDLKVTLPGMKKDTQSIGIILLPGKPHSLHVKPEENPITTENGNPVRFEVEVHDEAGNITAQPKQIVRCQIQGLKPTEADCRTGVGQLVTEPINLKITKGEPQKLKVQFAMPSQRNVALVVRELKVLPSTRVSSMELYRRDDENLVLRPNEEIDWVAGGLLEHLCYRLFDEAGKEVPLTAEIASKIKVNWTQVVNLTDLAQGMLPDVPVPKLVQEEPRYVVSYQDVSASFNIAPRPDEPKRLKATLPQTSVKLGETLPGDINLELVDRYGNATNTLIPTCVNYMSVEAEGLDKSAIKFMWRECSSSVLVTGVRFLSGTPGAREMCFTYRNYEDQVVLKVTPGVPAQLKLVSQPEEVLNDQGISTPFVVQLCDKWGNPSPDRRVGVQLSSSPPTLKVTANVMSQPVDSEGKASFIVHSVSGKGYYQLNFNVSINMKPLPGPSVNLTVIPDPNKPVSLSVEFDSTAKFPAGGKFPVFSVTVVSDEGSPMTNFNPADVSMFLWSEEAAGNEPPLTATKLTCSQKTHCFLFRDKEIPEQAEKHTIQFSLRIGQTKYLFSDQIPIHVVANQPVKLEPDSPPPPPVVSYSKAISSRTLVENMTLRIRDLYGNPAGKDLDGKVKVSIMNSSGDDNNKILPQFEGRVNSIQFNLVEGKADITRLTVMENSPGENGSSYILLFKPEVSMVSTALDPFELQFHFVNDVDNQLKMSQLSKRKDDLTRAVVAYKEILDDYNALLEVLTAQHLDTSRKETQLREDLNRRNIRVAQNVSIPDVDRLKAEKMAEVDGIERMPRRVFSTRDNFMGQQDVLGMVGHLAFVQDDDAARVISWHIRGDMDCIITTTKDAAMKIYNNTQGRQQVLPLSNIFIPSSNRPLPHIRNGRDLFKPSGNPVYARELLIYRQDQKSCDTVFKNILGDTILIDDLDSANNYREKVVQNKTPCPTILTRQGDRVSARGKFGGAQNKAPSMNTLHDFGAPYPQQFHILKEEIELLSNYRSALQKRDEAVKERDDHLSKMRSPETRKMTLEMKEKEKQLKEIERQYVSTPVKPVKRGPGDAGEPSGINTKRARP